MPSSPAGASIIADVSELGVLHTKLMPELDAYFAERVASVHDVTMLQVDTYLTTVDRFIAGGARVRRTAAVSWLRTLAAIQRSSYLRSRLCEPRVLRGEPFQGLGSAGHVFFGGRDRQGLLTTRPENQVLLTITSRGHWYLSTAPRNVSNDRVCQGCRFSGHFDYQLDYRACTRPPAPADIHAALRLPEHVTVELPAAVPAGAAA